MSAPVLPTHIVSAAGIVRDEQGRVLLVKHNRRGWVYPGGMVEPGETLPQAAAREILEETGITAEIGELFCVASSLAKKPGYNGVREIPTIVNCCFLCRYVSGEPRPSAENAETAWFSAAQAAELIQSPSHAAVYRAFLDYTGRPAYLAYKTWPEFVLIERRKI